MAEYWLVDPIRETIETFVIDADTTGYAATGVFRIGQSVSSQVVPGFTVPVKAAFDAGANLAALRTLLTAQPVPIHQPTETGSTSLCWLSCQPATP